MPSNKIVINHKVLEWARESANIELFEVPKSIISSDKLLQIERGYNLPTFIQLQKLAKKYERPLGTLMGNDIPEYDYLSIPFFRKENKTDYDSSITLFIRDIQDKQEWARNYLLSEGNTPLDFVGSTKITDQIAKVSLNLKNRLEMPSFNSFRNNKEYLLAIKKSFESHGIFISITGSNQSNKAIDINQAQGFAISDTIAPYVFINSKNTTNAKIFTLVHEVVHLFLNVSGISEDVIRFRKPICQDDEIENYCNEVASEVLMPETVINYEFNKAKGTIEERIQLLSKKFLISELAICVKLWRLRLITYEKYTSIYKSINKKIQEFLNKKAQKQKEQNGGNYYYNMRLKNGLLLSSLVYSAYKSGNILSVDLSNILKIKTNNIDNYFSTI